MNGVHLTIYRLSRLETAVNRLLARIGDDLNSTSTRPHTPPIPPLTRPRVPSASELPVQTNDTSIAPVIVIRDLAAQVGVHSPSESREITKGIPSDDVIHGGLLSLWDAVSLLTMYVTIYIR